MRLIGQKSLGCRASAFFGIKVRYAELSSHNFLASPYCSTMMAAMKSALIKCQQDLKNRHVYPSGPGALSGGKDFIVSHTSSFEIATSNADRSTSSLWKKLRSRL
jgi:hypothetical protein